MMKLVRKLCSLLLVVMMVMTVCPVTALAANQITTTTATVEKHFNQLKKMATDGKFFTTGDGSKPCHLNSHGSCWNTSGKTYCSVADVCQQRWLLNYVDYNVANANLLPGQFFPNGSAGGNSGNSCYGFANYAMWYIFSATSSSDMYKELSAKSTFTKDNITKLVQSGKLKKGYIIRSKDPNYSEMDAGHSIVFDKIDSGGNGIYVLDCNWNHNTVGNSKIQYHYVAFDTPYFKNMPIAVTKPGNVTVADQPTTYTVTYNANGGSGAPSAQTKTKDVSLTLSTTRPSRAGYNFLGWATSASATSAQYQPGSTYTANANITLYAVWEAKTYAVRYDANGGTGAPATQNKVHDKTLTLSSVIPHYEGHVFKEWRDISPSGDGTWSETKPTSGNYETGYLYYSYGYEYNGDKTYCFGAVEERVANHMKEALGSNYDATKMRYFWLVEQTNKGSSYEPVAKGGSLVANYRDYSGKTGTMTIPYTMFFYKAPVYKQEVVSQTSYQPGGTYTANRDVTLVAVWEEAPTTYTISYNGNGGSGAPSAQTKTKDVSLTLSTTRPTRAGYNFLGWATSSSAVSAQYQPGSTYTANANITLYAVWEELNTIAINAANFPDANFRTVVSTFDKNGDGKLNEAEIAAVTAIYCDKKNISSLKGIECFTALTTLWCYGNQLTALDVSKNTALMELHCGSNQLTTLDVSKNTALNNLHCFKNRLTTLDVSKNTALTELHCGSNQLTTLDVSKNTALNNLYCFSNRLTTLDVSKNTALTELHCDSNQLTVLDVSKNTVLKVLDCSFNQLTTLDVSKNTALTVLSCVNNRLTTLDVSKNTALKDLNCDDNQLTTLDVRRNTALESLSCFANRLTTLDVSKNTALTELHCGSNQLTTLDVSKNTALDVLWCYNNRLTTLDVSKNTALTELECESNSYDITLNASQSYDLSKLPGSFDVSKAKSWNGCTIQGSVIKVNAGVNKVSYTYDCGNGKTMPVTLNVVGVEAPATYSVRFNANGGYGSMAAVSNVSGLYTLPSCTFEAPSGKQFKGWAVSPNGNVITGNSYNITADTTFYAVWEQQEVTGCCLEVGKMVATHGKEVLVPISISQNPGFAGINVKIDYDKTRLQFIGSGDIAGLDWTVNTGDNAGAVMVSTKNYTKNGEILLLKFKVLEDAPDGFAKVSLFNVDVLTIDEKPISVTVSSGGVEVITRLPGDVTGDGVIDTRDALRLKKHLAGMDAPIVWQNADVTGDNDVTLADLLRLMKYLAGMQVELV